MLVVVEGGISGILKDDGWQSPSNVHLDGHRVKGSLSVEERRARFDLYDHD